MIKDSTNGATNLRSGVYLIYCVANGKAYVGSSKNVNQRITRHRHDLRHNQHGNQHLQNAWNLYGEQSFKMAMLHRCDEDEVLLCEQWWLDIWVSSGMSFNRRAYADSPMGVRWTQEERMAKSEAMKANPPFKGKTHTDAARALLSAHAKSRTGARNPFFGKTYSEETKAKVAAANTGNTYCVGRQYSDESRAKMSASQKLRTHSDETKAKISQATRGENNPRFGKKMSEESKNKARATRAANRAAGLHKA